MADATPEGDGAPPPPARSGGVFTRSLDRSSERATALNQFLFAAVVFIVALLVALDTDFSGHAGFFFAGVVGVFVLTGLAVVIPWNRLPFGWVAVVPAMDILAIAVMRMSGPSNASGLLWVFPAMWLAGSFGLLGLLGVVAGTLVLGTVFVVVGMPQTTHGTLMLPLVILGVAAITYLNARRSGAQRSLLAKQAVVLRGVLTRTRQQEQELTEVLDTVDFGVIRIRADGRIVVTNEAHGRLQMSVGGDGDEPVPAFRDDGVTPLPRAELPLERALAGEAFDDQIVWFGEEGGARRALSVTARRMRGSDGSDAGAVVVSRDVTNELNALRARDDLVASVSHELRTPLTSILGYLDLAIEDPGISDRVRANLDIAERNAERLLSIVADVLAASSSSSSSIEASIVPRIIDARDLVRAAAEAMSPHAEARAITLDMSGLEDAFAWADPLRMRQVLDNLLSNAIHYNRDGGTVHLGTTSDGVHTWILVRDTGPGISDEDRARLFQRYYKAGVRRRAGTGLGLAITRDIVRAHGGELGLHTSLGVGSTFIVKIPSSAPERTVR